MTCANKTRMIVNFKSNSFGSFRVWPQISVDPLVAIQALQSLALDVFTDNDRPGDGTDEHPKLPKDVILQSGEWDSTQPAAGETQWANVRKAWQTPDIVVPAAQGASTLVQDLNTVDVALGMCGDAFGWPVVVDFAAKGANAVNGLRNELKREGADTPIVWQDFETLYMAAPMIGVSA